MRRPQTRQFMYLTLPLHQLGRGDLLLAAELFMLEAHPMRRPDDFDRVQELRLYFRDWRRENMARRGPRVAGKEETGR